AGVKVRGPLSGNGNAISYNFRISTPEEAGIYTIERTDVAGITTCVQKIVSIFSGYPDEQTFSGSGYMCTSGSKTLLLENSQLGVNYYLDRDGYPENQYAGTGGPIQMNVNYEGVYSMRAAFTNCSNAFRQFGSVEVRSSYPEKPT